MWVREQYTYVLFTENWSNVAATVHVPYMNSSRKWEKTREKKEKKKKKGKRSKLETQETQETRIQTHTKSNFGFHPESSMILQCKSVTLKSLKSYSQKKKKV